MNEIPHEPTEEEFRKFDEKIRTAIRGKCLLCFADVPKWENSDIDDHMRIYVDMVTDSIQKYHDANHLNEIFFEFLRWAIEQGDFGGHSKDMDHHLCPDCMDRVTTVYHLYLHNIPYRNYLKSPEWHRTRNRKLKSAQNRCQLCNSKKHLNVHHRTYERRGYEDDEDLIVLCNHCHAKFHDKLPENE